MCLKTVASPLEDALTSFCKPFTPQKKNIVLQAMQATIIQPKAEPTASCNY
jgi:N-dimethylarginine dimethylaminohydrolase